MITWLCWIAGLAFFGSILTQRYRDLLLGIFSICVILMINIEVVKWILR